ncbi:MAG TPA: DUF2752 domain-containing protein [Clostridia bacterium]|nr:DUF2752 domain-containing protein [Clostridia bacterium]
MKKALAGIKELMTKYKALLGIVFMVAIVSLMDGNTCLFKLFSGMPCPGCGMTRAYMRLAHLNISAALFYHPLFVIPPILAVVILFKNKGYISKVYKSNIFWGALLIVILGVWAARMFLLFPDTPPMDYYKGSLIGKIFAFAKGIF